MALKYVLNALEGRFDLVDRTGTADVPANCLSTDGVNSLVYITGAAVGGRIQVSKVDISNVAKMPAVGMITSKSTDTECVVQLFGPVKLAGGLTPGSHYFVGSSGYMTKTRPTPSGGAYAMIQIVGVAHDTTVLFLNPSNNLTKVIS